MNGVVELLKALAKFQLLQQWLILAMKYFPMKKPYIFDMEFVIQ